MDAAVEAAAERRQPGGRGPRPVRDLRRIGRPEDPDAVVDSRFRVIGAQGLRIVDASVFPRIPGFFIACAVYMVGEKAADMILEGT